MIYIDRTLSQKLERTEARANADFVDTRARLDPECGATWIEVAGTYAMFDGVSSPLTQTFGLGIFEDTTPDQLEEIEGFFSERGADVFHEVSPLADPSLMDLLARRGYRPVEMTSVMFLSIADLGFGISDLAESELHQAEPAPRISARRATVEEADLWAETAASGWSTEHESLAEFMLAFGKIAARTQGGYPFLAELKDRPIAAGGFQIYEDVCILAGASTVPGARRQGAQNALLDARLRFGKAQGCRLAMMCALPGSQSQKNAQKNGFQIAYTRTKWHLTV